MRELAAVLVLVAIQAARERDVRFEILGLVAILASYGRMFAEQRIVGLAMVETIGGKNLLPAAGGVAARAIAAEALAVRVLVARRAVVEKRDALVRWTAVRRLAGPGGGTWRTPPWRAVR